MESSSRPRATANLSESVHRRLSMYALTASAAGVSVLALAQPSEGKIIYTPTHHVIGPGTSYSLDLNHDGKSDFILLHGSFCGTDLCVTYLTIDALADNAVNGIVTSNRRDAFALTRGKRVDSKQLLDGTVLLASVLSFTSCAWGYWCNVKDRYLGLKLKIKGKSHYGWARLSVSTGPKLRATLTGYAYETIPNKPIIAGNTKGADDNAEQPETLGRLALGAK